MTTSLFIASNVSPVTPDNLNTYGQTCDNVDQLRGFIGVSGVQVYMRGYTNPNDGGQGNFYWSATATGADNGGVTIIKPDGAGTMGRWVRLDASGDITSTLNGILTTNVNVDIVGASGITVTPNAANRQIVLTSTGVTTINSLASVSGNIIIAGNSPISVSSSGNTVTISASGLGTGDMISSVNLAQTTGGVSNTAAAVANLGLTIGANTQAWSAMLDNIAALASNGLITRTGAGAVAARTVTAGSAKISITNGSGASGNPTIDLGTVTLDNLSDVVITSATNGQVLLYNSGSGNWINGSAGALSIGLDDLNDVVITTPTNGQTLVYNSGSGNWVNAAGSGSINTAADYTWTGTNIFGGAGGKNLTVANPNYSAGTRATGWYSDTANPGNFLFVNNRLLMGEATLNAGSQTAGTGSEWVEGLSNATVRIAQFASVNYQSGIGVLGASRTSDLASPGSQGTQAVTAISNNNNTSVACSSYGMYVETWKQSTTASDGIAQGIEIAVINKFASTNTQLSTNPYAISVAGLVEGLRVGVGKAGTSELEASTAISIVNVPAGVNTKFRRGIVFGSDVISSGGGGNMLAISMAQGHAVSWWVDSANIGPFIRSDVSASGSGFKQIFGNNGFYIQEPVSSNNLWSITNSGSASAGVMTLNNQVLDFYAMKHYSSLVNRTSAQAISPSTWTTVVFQAVQFDDLSMFDGSTRYTIPSGVTRVRVAAQCMWGAFDVSTGARMNIKKNGVPFASDSYVGEPSGCVSYISGVDTSAISGPLDVTAGDYFEVEVFQSSSGSVNIAPTNSKNAKMTWFSIEILK